MINIILYVAIAIMVLTWFFLPPLLPFALPGFIILYIIITKVKKESKKTKEL